MTGFRSCAGVLAVGLFTVAVMLPTPVVTQEQFQFVVSARDAAGNPVTDLKTSEIVMLENGKANEIVKVEPFHMPVKLTIAVDNGILSREALGDYRTGLDGLVKALPPEVEVALIAMAPQPRFVVQSTSDRVRVLRGLTSFAPESATPRFIDTIVEFSKRLQDDFKKTKRINSLPVLVLVSTTSAQTTSYQAPEVTAALQFLETRKIRAYVTMYTPLGTTKDQGDQPALAVPLVNATRGRYEAINASSRLATVLPEFGTEIAALQTQHHNQFLVTAARATTGPLQDPRVELTRPNVQGLVSVDGLP
jgi:hypothetical protein